MNKELVQWYLNKLESWNCDQWNNFYESGIIPDDELEEALRLFDEEEE